MLVLSRQRDETIMIGDDVEITIVDIRGDKVRLGITAPRSIQVHRKEVYDAIKRENQQASRLKPSDVADVVDHKKDEKVRLKPVRDNDQVDRGRDERNVESKKSELKPDAKKKQDDLRPSEGSGCTP